MVRKEKTEKSSKEKVVELFNKVLELEPAGVVRYTHYYLMVFGYNRVPIVAWLHGQATESLVYAHKAGELIAHLGGPRRWPSNLCWKRTITWNLFALRRQPSGKSTLAWLIGMARELGIQTMLEGIETCDDLAEARCLQVDYVQGYLFSKHFVRMRGF